MDLHYWLGWRMSMILAPPHPANATWVVSSGENETEFIPFPSSLSITAAKNSIEKENRVLLKWMKNRLNCIRYRLCCFESQRCWGCHHLYFPKRIRRRCGCSAELRSPTHHCHFGDEYHATIGSFEKVYNKNLWLRPTTMKTIRK